MRPRIIRRHRVIDERNEPKPPVEYPRATLDVVDDGDNLTEVLGRVADLAIARRRLKWPSRSIPTSACSRASERASFDATTNREAARDGEARRVKHR